MSKYQWATWFKAFLEEWESQAGYKLECDEITEERYMTEFYLEDITPAEAVLQETTADF